MLQGSPSGARLLTVRAVAARLAVSPSTVHGRCSRGRLRFVHMGATVRIDPASVEAFISTGGDGPPQT